MANRQLTEGQLQKANLLLDEIRARLKALSSGDAELLFAYRRKVAKELGYDERSKPSARKRVKAQQRLAQGGLCALCKTELPPTHNVLDRFVASKGYTLANTRLICQPCDTATQVSRKYK